jgi:hypothetical protein
VVAAVVVAVGQARCAVLLLVVQIRAGGLALPGWRHLYRHPATLPQLGPIAGDGRPPLSETIVAISVDLVDFVDV